MKLNVLGRIRGCSPVLVLSLLILGGSHAAHASHPFQGSGNPNPDYNINYLYRCLEVPTGLGMITYSVCGTAEHPGVPAEWGTGVEQWDNAIARWSFNLVSCSANADTRLTWATTQCPGGWACWDQGGNTPGHGSHRDIRISTFRPTSLYFNYNAWYGTLPASPVFPPGCPQNCQSAWRVWDAAHE